MMHENVHHLCISYDVYLYLVHTCCLRPPYLWLKNLASWSLLRVPVFSHLHSGLELCSRSPPELCQPTCFWTKITCPIVHVTCTHIHLSAPLPSSYSCKIICRRLLNRSLMLHIPAKKCSEQIGSMPQLRIYQLYTDFRATIVIAITLSG